MRKALMIVIVLVLAGATWWFASPLFLSKTVDEDFPTLEELEEMTPEEKAEIQDNMMGHAASQPPTVVEENMPEEQGPELLAGGEFRGADAFHKGSGNVRIYKLEDGSRIARFENFSVTNGPDLRVLLATGGNSTDSDSLGEYIELGRLKGNQGNQNYDIPENVDVRQYSSIVIYCKPFHVVFSTANLENLEI